METRRNRVSMPNIRSEQQQQAEHPIDTSEEKSEESEESEEFEESDESGDPCLRNQIKHVILPK